MTFDLILGITERVGDEPRAKNTECVWINRRSFCLEQGAKVLLGIIFSCVRIPAAAFECPELVLLKVQCSVTIISPACHECRSESGFLT